MSLLLALLQGGGGQQARPGASTTRFGIAKLGGVRVEDENPAVIGAASFKFGRVQLAKQNAQGPIIVTVAPPAAPTTASAAAAVPQHSPDVVAAGAQDSELAGTPAHDAPVAAAAAQAGTVAAAPTEALTAPAGAATAAGGTVAATHDATVTAGPVACAAAPPVPALTTDVAAGNATAGAAPPTSENAAAAPATGATATGADATVDQTVTVGYGEALAAADPPVVTVGDLYTTDAPAANARAEATAPTVDIQGGAEPPPPISGVSFPTRFTTGLPVIARPPAAVAYAHARPAATIIEPDEPAVPAAADIEELLVLGLV